MRKLIMSAALLCSVLAAGPARAQAPNDSLPYVTSIRTIPAQPCDSIPTMLVIEGVFPTQCGAELTHDDDNFTLYISDPFHSCVECPPPQRTWSDSIEIGLLPAGRHAVILTMGVVNFCPTPPDTHRFHQRFEFDVFPDCLPQPPPIDPMAYINVVSITSERPSFPFICEGDSVRVRLGGFVPNGCYFVRSISHTPMRGDVPPGPFDVQIVFDNACCATRLCAPGPQPWQAEIMLPPAPPGIHNMTVTAVEVCCRDSILPGDPTGRGTWPFSVTSWESCGVAPPTCMYPKWLHAQTEQCDAYFDPQGNYATVTLMIGNSVPLAGIQGKVHSSSGIPLRVVSMEPVGVAAGMHLSWEPEPDGARFVLFADSGAPIPANFGRRESQVLKIKWAMRVMPANERAPDPVEIYIISTSDLFGSDIDGGLVPLSPLRTGESYDVAKICIGGGGACDVNGDRYTDVRDLVLMAHCLGGIGPCPADPANTLDCESDHDFDFDDLVCCSHAALGIPPCPECGDSIRTENGIGLAFGTPRQSASSIDIPVRIDGSDRIGAARLSFSLPGALLSGAQFVLNDAGWLPVNMVRDGKLEVGLVELAAVYIQAPPPYVDGILRLAVPPGTDPAGTIALVQSDLSGRDGVKLAVDFGSPVVRLGPGVGASLSPARPNPFGASTSFRLNLDAQADADVAVYDLSGRRIATIHKGPLAIGSHAFTWNGRGSDGTRARAGVFFVRASVGGQVTKQKLVMLKE